MSLVTIDSVSQSLWTRVSRSLKAVWARPESGDNPYSPLLCLALLLAVGLLVKLGH